MRVTSSMYYDNLYGTNNSKLSKELFDVNKQIASRLQIQYASDDVDTFAQTMRLDNELTVLGQVKSSTDSGYKVSNQSDVTLNEFDDSLIRMRTLLLQAANDGESSEASLDAIAKELRGIEKNLKGLANTSINGQYLFSGSVIDVKPISDDGTYNGNNISMNAFLGSQNQQQYNITGSELFLGEESSVRREITSNVVNENLTDGTTITSSNTIKDLMGDKDGDSTTVNTSYFYLRGTQSDGTTFKEKFTMSDDDSIDSLLNKIGEAYGNSSSINVVNVTMNNSGQIVIEDKQKGSSKLDFSLVGAVDYNGGGLANVNDIDRLAANGGETTYPPSGNLYIKEFITSGLSPASGAGSIEGALYDRVEFSTEGSTLSSNVSQVLKSSNTSTNPTTYLDTNAFATNSTKISDVADLSQGTADTLDGTKFNLTGTEIDGLTPYDITINLDTAGSTFKDNSTGNSYDIFNMANPRTAVDADEMTYRQLMDVVNMAVTGILPTANDETSYDDAISNSTSLGETNLSYDGKIEFEDASAANTKATISLYDTNSAYFAQDASVMAFNANNALTISDPKTDFFKSINEMITAVEEQKNYPNTSTGTARNLGIQNAIALMDDIQNHMSHSHSTVGANSNTLTIALERTSLLELSTQSLRSSVIDTDLAESTLQLTQLTLNYQAMLSTVSKVSQLSLVNYL